MQDPSLSYVGARRELALELVHATEAAALTCAAFLGKGDPEQVSEAAGDAMRAALEKSGLTGTVVLSPRHQTFLPAGTMIGGGDLRVDLGIHAIEGASQVARGHIDAAIGIGDVHAALIAACAVRCLGGEFLARLVPRNDEESKLIGEPRIFSLADLAPAADISVSISGVSGGPLLPAVAFGSGYAETSSLVMSSRQATIRRLTTRHHTVGESS